MTVVVFGSINMDLTVYSDRLPKPGETLHGERYLTGLGGKGANQAVAAARLGVPTRMIGRVGRDYFGKTAIEVLQGFGVDVRHVVTDPANPTGIAMINVDHDGENFITVIAGANYCVDVSDVEAAAKSLSRASVLLLQLEVPWPAMTLAAQRARSGGAKIILDPAPAPSDPAHIDLSLIDILTPNEIETEILTGIRPRDAVTAADAARLLHAKGPATVVIKMGERGAYLSTGSNGLLICAIEVDTVDTVGAGDCFNGGLAYALSRGFDPAEAVRFASACGALATARYGAAASAPTLPEVEILLSGP